MNRLSLSLKSALSAAFLTLFLACSSMQVQTAADPQADLAQYKTYAWAPHPAATNGQPTTILDQTVKSSVERNLATKGLEPVTKDSQPDLLINYFGASRNVVNYSPSPDYGYPMYPYYGTTYVDREGSLTLQFIDPKTKRIVWQGTATDVIGKAGASPEQVANAVKQLLSRYPTA